MTTLAAADGGVTFFSQLTVRFAILGVASGALVGLVALGIVLVYRSSQVLNFSAGALGAISAFLFYSLRDSHGWNQYLALVVALALGAVLGAGSGLALNLLSNSSLLAKLIATLGLLSLGQGVVSVIWGTNSSQPDSILPTRSITLTSQILISEDRLILIGVVIALAVVLRVIYAKTLFGLATSAVSENRTVAAASAWSPLRIELINFTVAGTLSAFAAIMLAPIITLQGSVIALTVLPALAAALVGRFSSFGLTIGAALLIGVIQSELSLFQPNLARMFHVSPPSLVGVPQMVPLVIIVLALSATGRSRPARGEIFAKLPLPGSGRIRPLYLVITAGVGALLLATLSATWIDAVTITFATAIVVLSIVVVTGYGGQLSLCQFGLAGAGCWVAAKLTSQNHVPLVLAMVIGVLVAMATGVVVALFAVRSRGVNFAIITLGLASMLEAVVFDNPSLTGGLSGFVIKSPHVFGVNIDPISHPAAYGGMALVLLIISGVLVANLRRGPAGRRLLAVRSNERAAASLGVGVLGAKLYAFGIAGGLAGLGGILLGLHDQTVQLTSFTVFKSVQAVLFAVFGGVGWASGAVAGAVQADGGLGSQVVSTIFHGITTIDYWLLIFAGVNVVIILRAAPDGLAALNSELLDRLRARLTGRAPESLARVATLSSMSPSVPNPQDPAEESAPALEVDGAALSSSDHIRQPLPDRTRPPATLEVRGMTVRFGGLLAVDNISFSVAPGEVVGLMGPNGAGKTTILDVITGFTAAQSGDIVLDDAKVHKWTPEHRARAGIVRSWQGVELFDEMTVLENLLVGADDHASRRYLTDLVRPGRAMITELMEGVISDFGIRPYLDMRPSSLPHGIARLVGIARAVVSRPRILLLDEPAAGLDIEESAELSKLLRRLATRQGLGILVVEHDVALMSSTCNRLVVMDFGKMVVDGLPEDVVKHPDVIRAYLGVEHATAASSSEEVDDLGSDMFVGQVGRPS